MPRFRFALSDAQCVREVGMVQTETFDDAIAALTDRFAVTAGDQLAIGVFGFPPARFRYVSAQGGSATVWQPVGEKAA